MGVDTCDTNVLPDISAAFEVCGKYSIEILLDTCNTHADVR
jgi:hypothetical protein